MKSFALLAAVLLAASCAQKEVPPGNVHVYGHVQGLKQGAIIIRNDENTKVLDSIPIKGDAHFESHFTLDSPQMLHLYLDRGVSKSLDNSLDIFAEPGDLKIETTLDRFYADAKVSGSKNHAAFLEFRKINQRYIDQQLDMTKQRLEAFKSQTPFDESAAIAESEKIESRRYLAAINFALNHKDLEVAPFIALSEIRSANTKLLDTLMLSLTPSVKASKYGKMLESFITARKAADQNSSIAP